MKNNKCTCERPNDNCCDYCDNIQKDQILIDAKEKYMTTDKKYTIELKHLAPYLPYGLKVQVEYNHLSKIHIVEVIGVHREELIYNSPYGNHDYVDISEVKPILRPLSDLTKEIEVNSEKFIPYRQLEHLACNRLFGISALGEYTLADVPELLYWEYQELIIWHFDVFGLIEKGLAIDINTLNLTTNGK